MKLHYLTFWSLLVIGLGSCTNSSKTPTDNKTPKPLQVLEKIDGQWMVTQINDGEKEYQLKKAYPLNLEENKLSLSLDVNNCGGGYTILPKHQIEVTKNIFCTEKCCDDKAAQRISQIIGDTWTYTLDGELMTWTKDKKIIQLKRHNASDLSGTSWRAVRMQPKEEGADHLFKKPYILSFSKENIIIKLDVNECNTSYIKNKGDQLEFAKSMGCTRACCDSDLAKQLAAYLSGTLDFKVKGDQLILGNTAVELEFARYKKGGE
ncbi:MAG: META domain-containing protein [Aureispira sp.]|nr:META domain-containing protein [Aureispira sp.]